MENNGVSFLAGSEINTENTRTKERPELTPTF